MAGYRTEILDVQGSPMAVLVFEPEGAGPHPGMVVAQHLPIAHAGLEKDPFTIDVGNKLAAAGYACVIPFIFHWWDTDVDVAVKREEFRDDWTVADLDAAYQLLGGLASVDEKRIGIMGHCWGGRVTWLGACHNSDYKAAVMLYGGRIKVPMGPNAVAPIELAAQIPCPVLGVFGNDDQNPSPADVDDLDEALTAANISHEFHRYDGAGHGFQDFVNTDRFREEAAGDAWSKVFAFLDANLK
jgi:carboxymethylenebutenolidase